MLRKKLIESAPEELLRIENPAMADWAEGYIAVKAHVYIRFRTLAGDY